MTELKRVMCVEDDPDTRLILKFSLERLGGFSLCLCSDGFDALDKVESFQPQLVLLDVMMPKLSGPQTLKKLRTLEVMRGVPVVFLTAKAMRNEVEALLEHGSTGIIVKPFDPVTLPKDVLIYWQHSRG
jgi:CheY-like chemotaxis protein